MFVSQRDKKTARVGCSKRKAFKKWKNVSCSFTYTKTHPWLSLYEVHSLRCRHVYMYDTRAISLETKMCIFGNECAKVLIGLIHLISCIFHINHFSFLEFVVDFHSPDVIVHRHTFYNSFSDLFAFHLTWRDEKKSINKIYLCCFFFDSVEWSLSRPMLWVLAFFSRVKRFNLNAPAHIHT